VNWRLVWLLSSVPLWPLMAQKPQDRDRTLVVVNADSALSGQIADYYVRRRGIAETRTCRVRAGTRESIGRAAFRSLTESPVSLCIDCLRGAPVHFLVVTGGLPIRVNGTLGTDGTQASVDLELATLYAKRARLTVPLEGGVANPMFVKVAEPFDQRRFPVYLAGRLAAYDLATVKRMIDHALAAEDSGNFVFDMKEGENENPGDRWMNDAAVRLPQGRVVVESTLKILTGQRRVLGYVSWGSNDSNRKQRLLGFEWLPGSVATEFVSTNGRTLARPPANWNLGNDWRKLGALFADSPQSMAADYLAEGATAVTAHTDEPFLQLTPRPDILLPADVQGRTLGEAYTASLQKLSWRNMLQGDPLMRLKPRH